MYLCVYMLNQLQDQRRINVLNINWFCLMPVPAVGEGGGGASSFVCKDIPLLESVYLVFTRMPGDFYRRRLKSLLLYLCISSAPCVWNMFRHQT